MNANFEKVLKQVHHQAEISWIKHILTEFFPFQLFVYVFSWLFTLKQLLHEEPDLDKMNTPLIH